MPVPRPRMYDALLARHLRGDRQMAFVEGPRQVGKTTVCRAHANMYVNMDNLDDRRIVLAGPAALAHRLGLESRRRSPPVVVLDELHKWRQWKRFLKGFYDTYERRVRILVTGSSRLQVYRRGGDSLMGRYFPYRMHPFSIAEVARPTLPSSPISRPEPIADTEFSALWNHGGFPEPFLRRRRTFSRRWQRLRVAQFLREDLRDLTQVQEVAQLGSVAALLAGRSATTLVYRHLADDVNASADTMRRWIDTLVSLHHGFLLRPWHRKVTRSLRKEPKWYVRDWAGVADAGARTETFIACHLLKAVEGWTDLGLGEFTLHYLRDKAHREVDFLVVRDGSPWFLVEAKTSGAGISPALAYFQKLTGAGHAFQVVLDMPYDAADCFRHRTPAVVSARTFLSQLL